MFRLKLPRVVGEIVGLKLDLVHHFEPMFLVRFCLYTTVFQIADTVALARLMRRDWLTSVNLGVAMTAKGGPGIVVATIAFDLGIVNKIFFVTLVLIAVITSLAAAGWFKYILTSGRPLMR